MFFLFHLLDSELYINIHVDGKYELRKKYNMVKAFKSVPV